MLGCSYHRFLINYLQVIAATNRIDILDPALLRSGRLDRKIEFPLPNEMARARILQIHSRKMSTSPDVNFDELARSTDEFNGAQLKAVCVEAGMIALREGATKLGHEHFLSGIAEGKLDGSYYFVVRTVIDDGRSSEQEEERFSLFRLAVGCVFYRSAYAFSHSG
jgi:SpoVK/Ycf46/Vps4 family AAA+-type ATPase